MLKRWFSHFSTDTDKDYLLTQIERNPRTSNLDVWRIPLSANEKRKIEELYYANKDNLYKDGVYSSDEIPTAAAMAWRLMIRYGELEEVYCVRGDFYEGGKYIELRYENGHKLVITDKKNVLDIRFISFGYPSPGSENKGFYAFLVANGFNTTLQEIIELSPPCTLYRNK